MKRLMAMLGAAALVAGCQAQNPYAMFGPNRVPTPGLQTPAPYYPPTAGGATATPPASSAASSRTSISVTPLAANTTAATLTDAGDKEPIRIIENPAPAARTATTGTTRSAGTPVAPAAGSPANSAPAAPNGKSSRLFRSDANVAPAAFESAAATGQWKSR